uniref:Protein LNK1 n=1 Tax=Triticum urartu TaxID=4572 RepID=A0A8R7U6C2_TRIUA
MPDWKAGEFEGKFKDEFARGNSNLQEDGAGPLNISNKKLKHGITTEENPQGVVSTATNSDSRKLNSDHIYSTCVVASDHVRDCKIESSAFPLSRDDTTSGTRYQTENWNNCQFALSNGSAVLNNHSVPQSDLNYGDNDLNFIDWPSIDNFEDVDTLFRGCDSTYGEQQLENTDELSWIPSSDAIYSSDVALQAGFDSSYSDYGMLDDLSAFPCAQDKSLPTADEQFNDNYPFNEQKNVDVYGEQAYQGGAMELLSTDQICNGDGNLDMIGERYSSENALQQLEDRKFSVPSGSQLSSSQNLLKQKHHSDKTSPSNITSDCYSDRNCQFSPSGSFAQRNLMGNIYKRNFTGYLYEYLL